MKSFGSKKLLQRIPRVKLKKGLMLQCCVLLFFCAPVFVVSAQNVKKSPASQQAQIAPQTLENLRQKIAKSNNIQLKKRWQNVDLTQKKTYQDVNLLADLMELDQKELFQK